MSRVRRGSSTVLGAALVAAVLALAGCQTHRDDAAGPGAPENHPCAGAPARETLTLDDGDGGEPSPEDLAWQEDAAALAQEVTAIAGERLAAVWLAWEPERSLQVRLTEGPELPAVRAAADAAGIEVDVVYVRAFSEAQLVAAANALGSAWAQVPGVGGMGVDTLGGRIVFDVASGDDDGAATCAALTEILADVDVPVGFEVFEGPTESTVREPVAFGEAWTEDGSTLHLTVSSCNGDPEITALEETATEVRLEITSTNAAPGWPSALCLDGVDVSLAAPLGDRTLIDLTTGRPVAVGAMVEGTTPEDE